MSVPAVRTRSRTAAGGDLALAALLALGAAVPGNGTLGVVLADLPTRSADPLLVLLVLVQTVPLVLRRSDSALCLGLVSTAFAVHQLLGYAPTVAGLGLYVALYSAGAHLDRRRRTVAAVALACYPVLAVALRAAGSPAGAVELATFLPVLVLVWVVGAWARTRRGAHEALRTSAAAAAVADERSRIARELHDVVSHHVTAMVVQAEAMQVLVGHRPETVTAGLGVIAETGRSAMTDLRDLLGALHGAGSAGRDPAVGTLADLADRGRAAGLVVELQENGSTAAVTTGVELAVYRVVQESLTNAVKHAPGSTAAVRVQRGAREVVVEVRTDGTGGTRRRWATSGRGLTGLEERVGFVGGRLAAGPEPDGGFAVRAWIPVGGRRD